ncbi:MAG: MBL fold metallo-hydrolase [Anaerolineae bacterium]|nr:MBL fold metallo-hydrolase [Anaerolineae bacterium]
MKLTYVRWSMTIIETNGLTLITDPVFRVLGIHQAPRSYTFEQMPRPDLVFISHTHIDHFEPNLLKRLPAGTPVLMAANKLPRAAGLGLAGLHGVHEWEPVQFRGLRLTVVPALHSGGEIGLVVESPEGDLRGDKIVYFAGDTSLDRNLFRIIAQRWRLDAVLLPIGDLRMLFFPFRHIGPKTGAQALRLLGEPRIVVPTHYSGMTLGPLLAFRGTPRKLSQAIHDAELGTVVGTTRPLESVEI